MSEQKPNTVVDPTFYIYFVSVFSKPFYLFRVLVNETVEIFKLTVTNETLGKPNNFFTTINKLINNSRLTKLKRNACLIPFFISVHRYRTATYIVNQYYLLMQLVSGI